MRVLLHSESPLRRTGYGVATNLTARLLTEAGHEVFVSTFQGHAGLPVVFGGVPLLPPGVDRYGNDVLEHYVRQFKPDALALLHDIFVIRPEILERIPAAAWTPVDQAPVPPEHLPHLRACRYQMAYSRFGEREMRKAGLDPLYVPLAFDEDVYQPMDRHEARQKAGVDDAAFYAVFVGTNLDIPSRKSVDRVLKAWARFVETRPDAVLYMHTNQTDADGGFDLNVLAEHYGILPRNLRLAEVYALRCGRYTPTAMATLYNAADVLLAPSRGEGFGLPALEAQACGCPVVVSGFSSQPELCFGGYTIPVDPFDDLTWSGRGGEQADIRADQILAGLEWAYEQRGNEALRAQARDGARAYAGRRIRDRYLIPALALMADMNQTQEVA